MCDDCLPKGGCIGLGIKFAFARKFQFRDRFRSGIWFVLPSIPRTQLRLGYTNLVLYAQRSLTCLNQLDIASMLFFSREKAVLDA